MNCKVLHVVTVPQSLRTFLRGQLRYLQDRGMRIQAMSSAGDSLTDFQESEGVETHALKLQRKVSPFRDLVAVLVLCRRLRSIRPQIVHAHTPKAGLVAMVAAWLMRVPVRIYHLRGLPMETATGWRRLALFISERLACLCAHRVLSVSRSVRTAAIQSGICRAEKIAVLANGSGNGVDFSQRFNPAKIAGQVSSQIRSELKIPTKACVMGFVGRLTRDKGILELREAWSMIRDQYPTLHFVVIGDSDSREPASEKLLAEFRADPRIHWVRRTDRVQDYYTAMDMLVLPTYSEGLPNVILEASAMKLPVVATAVTGCVDALVDGTTGTLVPMQNPTALAAAIAHYADSKELREHHGSTGRHWVEQSFRQEDIWDALYAEYSRLVKQYDPTQLETVGQVDTDDFFVAA